MITTEESDGREVRDSGKEGMKGGRGGIGMHVRWIEYDKHLDNVAIAGTTFRGTICFTFL